MKTLHVGSMKVLQPGGAHSIATMRITAIATNRFIESSEFVIRRYCFESPPSMECYDLPFLTPAIRQAKWPQSKLLKSALANIQRHID